MHHHGQPGIDEVIVIYICTIMEYKTIYQRPPHKENAHVHVCTAKKERGRKQIVRMVSNSVASFSYFLTRVIQICLYLL